MDKGFENMAMNLIGRPSVRPIKAVTARICPHCGANLEVWKELGLGEHNHYDAGGNLIYEVQL